MDHHQNMFFFMDGISHSQMVGFWHWAIHISNSISHHALTMMESNFSKLVLLYGSTFPICTPSARESIQHKASCKCWKAHPKQIKFALSLTSMFSKSWSLHIDFLWHLESIWCCPDRPAPPSLISERRPARKSTDSMEHLMEPKKISGKPSGQYLLEYDVSHD